MKSIKILNPGLLTTVQDKGRWGYQKFGMSVAGVMDDFAYRIANMLVNNNENEAVLETTLVGVEILFNCDEIISITGGNMNPKVNGIPVPMWTSIFVNSGDKLSSSGTISGLRSYIAFSRGIEVPEIMGSKSTFTRGNLGGFEGRKLAKEDIIILGEKELSRVGSFLPEEYKPIYSKEHKIRVVLGPQDDYFSKEAIEVFLNSKYTITSEADRMGYRLDGPKIEHINGADIVSDGVVFGSIQVPGHGSPIIMMADRQTTGGYTKIATVITPDLSKLAQMSPGNWMNFEMITIEKSHIIYKEYEHRMETIKDFVKENNFEFNEVRNLKLSINGTSFNVGVREVE
jgi:biotin-dependent carboxylase-like uncharacterized protein